MTNTESNMDRNERIEITPIQNGYLVEYSYREMKDGGGEFDYRYMSERYSFINWEDVVEWVQDKKLLMPAVK